MNANRLPAARVRGVGLLLLLMLAMLLSGCAVFRPPPPYTTEADALADRGEPTRRWTNEDGTTVLEYSTQPNGYTCLMVEVDRSGVVRRRWDAVSGRNLAEVRPGMSREEVDRMLGEHRSEQTFRLSGEEVWDWNIYNDGPGIATLFNVHFIDGKVVRTSRTYVYPNDGGLLGGYYYGRPYGYGFWGGYPFGWPYRAYHPYAPWFFW